MFCRTILCLLFLCYFTLSIDLPLSAQSGPESKYHISFVNSNEPYIKAPGATEIQMTSREGRKYTCFIPEPRNKKPIERELDGSYVFKTQETLEEYEDKSIYLQTGWWTYQFKINKFVKQYHQEGDSTVVEYFLGYHNENINVELLKKEPIKIFDNPQKMGVPYYSETYTSGTFCELSNKPREVVIRYFCTDKSRDYIEDFKEPSTCSYTLDVNLHALCNIPEFTPINRPTVDTVVCQQQVN